MAIDIAAYTGTGLRLLSAVGSFIKSRLERRYQIYVLLRFLGFHPKDSGFDTVYISTLYELIHVKGKPKNIIRLFEIQDVKHAFRSELYDKNNWSFFIEVDAHVHTNPAFRYLKRVSFDIKQELNDFRNEFRIIVNNFRTPAEVSVSQDLSSLSESISTLQDSVEDIREKLGGVDISQQGNITSEVTPLVVHISKRNKVVGEFRSLMQSKNILLLRGSIATGKTQLAALIFEQENTSKFWVGLRHTDENTFLATIWSSLSKAEKPIHGLSDFVRDVPNNSMLVLDDLPRLSNQSVFVTAFSQFLLTLSKKKIRLICTSNYLLPPSILDVLPETLLEKRVIPFLTEEEVSEILIAYSATEDQLEKFTPVVHSISKGHPTITAAIARFLKDEGWNLNSTRIGKIFGSDYSIDLTETTYTEIVHTIRDEESRELLYRLNLVRGRFTEKHVKLVSEIQPEISSPQEKLSQMSGLWVQREGAGSYEVSPLISRLGPVNVNLFVARKIYLALGSNILSKKRLSQFEAIQAIEYFIKAEEYNQAGFVLVLALNASQTQPDIFFDWGFSLYWVYDALPAQMDSTLRLQIRSLQLMLFNKRETEHQVEINKVTTDLERIVRADEVPAVAHATGMLYLSIQYSKTNAHKALELYLEGTQLLQKLAPGKAVMDNFEIRFGREQILWSSTRGVNTIDEAHKWFDVFDTLPDDQKQKALAVDEVRMGAAFLTEHPMRHEQKKPVEQQDWPAMLAALEALTERSKGLKFDLLTARTIKCRIIVLNDKLNRLEDAKVLADEWINRLSESTNEVQFLMNNAIAHPLFQHNRKEEAKIYAATAAALGSEIDNFYVEKLDAYLLMNRILGEGDRTVAHVYIEKAFELVSDSTVFSDAQRIRVIGEIGISLAEQGQIEKAIYKMEEGFDLLIQRGDSLPDFKELVMKYGHVVNYYDTIHHRKKQPKMMDGSTYEVPYRGYFYLEYTQQFVKEQWTDERTFIVCLLFISCFEYFGDKKKAIKWATALFIVEKALKSNAFSAVIHAAVPYYILNDHYDEAFECQVIVRKGIAKREEAIQNIGSQPMKEMLQKDKELIPKPLPDYDGVFMTTVAIPITLRLLSLEQTKEGEITPLIDRTISSFDRWKTEFKDPGCMEVIREFFVSWRENTIAPDSIIERIKSYKANQPDSVTIIGYLIAASRAVPLQAFQLHAACVKTLTETISIASKGTYKFLLMPYFEKFWFDKTLSNSEDFEDVSFIRLSGIPFYKKTEDSRKMQALFKILLTHLKHAQVGRQLEDWVDS